MEEIQALAVGLCSLEIGAVVDTAFYGQATLSPWNFFRSNILEAKALAFGVKPWHFHLTEVSLLLVVRRENRCENTATASRDLVQCSRGSPSC